MSENKPLQGGVVPPLVSPLTSEDEPDLASLRRLVRFQIDAGVDGLFVLGSSGEGSAFGPTDRRRIIETVVDAAERSVPVYAGVIEPSTRRAIEALDEAAELGADAAVATAPFYVDTQHDEVLRHFDRLANRGLPVLAYNIPSRVGYTIAPTLARRLAASGSVAGLKDSSGDTYALRSTIAGLRADGTDGFAVFSGSEVNVDIDVRLGVDGVVPGLANVDPHGYVRLFDAARRGDLSAGRVEQERLIALFEIVHVAVDGRRSTSSAALGAFKTALRVRGVIADAMVTTSNLPFSPAQVGRIAELMDDAGLGPVSS